MTIVRIDSWVRTAQMEVPEYFGNARRANPLGVPTRIFCRRRPNNTTYHPALVATVVTVRRGRTSSDYSVPREVSHSLSLPGVHPSPQTNSLISHLLCANAPLLQPLRTTNLKDFRIPTTSDTSLPLCHPLHEGERMRKTSPGAAHNHSPQLGQALWEVPTSARPPWPAGTSPSCPTRSISLAQHGMERSNHQAIAGTVHLAHWVDHIPIFILLLRRLAALSPLTAIPTDSKWMCPT